MITETDFHYILISIGLGFALYILWPLQRPARAYGTVTGVRQIRQGQARLLVHIPTVEFVDEHGKRHVIQHSELLPSRTLGEKWSFGDSIKLCYHPNKPHRATATPSYLSLIFAGVMLFASIGMLIFQIQGATL